jgi:peptidoglycan-associated lipoprotein
MKSRVSILTMAATAALVLGGCHHKHPVTTAELAPAPPPAPVQAAVPPPAPAPAPAFDPWSGDLDAVNAYIQEHDLLGDVYFEYDRAELREEARQRLAKNGRFLNEHPDFVVSIEGHCDERGTAAYNLALGQSRGYSAKEYLGQLGTDPARLQTISYGRERPICNESDENCWWRNRRAHFVVVGRGAASRAS